VLPQHAPHTFSIYPAGYDLNDEKYRRLKAVLDLKYPDVEGSCSENP
jgi:hypothetical protein